MPAPPHLPHLTTLVPPRTPKGGPRAAHGHARLLNARCHLLSPVPPRLLVVPLLTTRLGSRHQRHLWAAILVVRRRLALLGVAASSTGGHRDIGGWTRRLRLPELRRRCSAGRHHRHRTEATGIGAAAARRRREGDARAQSLLREACTGRSSPSSSRTTHPCQLAPVQQRLLQRPGGLSCSRSLDGLDHRQTCVLVRLGSAPLPRGTTASAAGRHEELHLS